MNFRTMPRLALTVLGLFLLGACAETQLIVHTAKRIVPGKPPPSGEYKVGNPYQIKGVWYYPAENFNYVETGVASWYGAKFHGRATANGEVYDMNALTAAHRTLPMPSIVRVTNLENGRSLKLKVNDRGPFAHGRIIDISRRGAQLLGFERKGTARVRIGIVPDESRVIAQRLRGGTQFAALDTPIKNADKVQKPAVTSQTLAPPPGAQSSIPGPATRPRKLAVADRPQAADAEVKIDGLVSIEPTSPTRLYIQAGAFTRYQNAYQVAARLNGVGAVKVTSAIVSGKEFFRVRVGPLVSLEKADGLLERVIATGYPNSRIIVD